MMYALLSFLVIFTGLGTLVYWLCKLEEKEELSREKTQKIKAVERKLTR